MEYLCYRVQDVAEKLCKDEIPYRRAFGDHLKLIAKALHDIEWVDSSDMSHPDDEKAIMDCISKSDVLVQVKKECIEFIKQIKKLLE